MKRRIFQKNRETNDRRKITQTDLERFLRSGRKEHARESLSGRCYDGIAATLAPDVKLHQSPDLPFGGEYVGHQQYEKWAVAMSAIFDTLEVAEQEWFENGDKVVVICRFKTHSRINGSTQDLPMGQIVTVKAGLITDFRPFYWNVPAYTAAARPSLLRNANSPPTSSER